MAGPDANFGAKLIGQHRLHNQCIKPLDKRNNKKTFYQENISIIEAFNIDASYAPLPFKIV